jgi:hypothetical protein
MIAFRASTKNVHPVEQFTLILYSVVNKFPLRICTDRLRHRERLACLGVKVESAGQMLTDMLKGGWHQLTF